VTATVLAVLGRGLVDSTAPIARADDPGLTRGDGCFEGCRVQTAPDGTSTVDKLEAHLARMARSAKALDIAFDPGQWRALVDEALAAWVAPGEAAMKLLLTRGPASAQPLGFAAIGPIPADYPRLRRDGLKVITLDRGTGHDAFADAPWLLGGVKTLSYAVNMAAQREAARRGADDAIFVSADGQVLEAPTSSVVWSDGRTLFTTPSGPSGILASTTLRLLFDRAEAAGWPTAVSPVSVVELHAAPVLWLLGSVRGPVDVVDLDGQARERNPRIDDQIRRLAGFPTSSQSWQDRSD